MSKKISDFTQQTALQGSDLLNIVRSGTNYNVTFTNVLESLGVTGSLNVVGDPLGIPILEQPSSTVNNFRSLESSKGVLASVSANNGIKLATNFAQGTTGQKIIKDLAANQLLFKSLEAGSDIAINDDGDHLRISFVGGSASTKTVLVGQESDFPSPVSGVITLANNTDYLITNDISTANRFVVGKSTTMRAASGQIVQLTYTGSGDMLTGVDPNFRAEKITLDCPNGNLLNMTAPGGNGIIQFVEMNVQSCNTGGTVSGAFICRFNAVAWEDIKTKGVTFSGSNLNLVYDTGVVFLNGGEFIDLGSATFNTVSIDGIIVQTSAGGTTFLKGAAASANINAGGLGVVTNNRIFGSASPLSGISSDDARWNFNLNDDIPDTRPDALLSFQTPTTTVLAAATPAKITGTWGIERSSQMTATTGGRVTYDGEKASTLPITCALSLEPVTGTNKVVNIYLAKNGSVITNSKVQTVVSSGSPKNQAVIWQDSLANGEYYECFIESVDGTDLQVNTATLRVN